MRKSHDAGSCRAAERQPRAAAAPTTVGFYMRRGGEGGAGTGKEEGREGGGWGVGARAGGGGVLFKTLKSGSGHHRHDVCVPSHGRE